MVKMANVRGQQKQAGSWNNADKQKLFLKFRYTVSNNHTMHANLVYEDPPPLARMPQL